MNFKMFLLCLLLFSIPKISAQSFRSIDSCSLKYLIKNSENLKFLQLMDAKKNSKKFKRIKFENNKSSLTDTYSSDYGNIEINYDNLNIWVKYKNQKVILNFKYKFTHEFLGIKKDKQMISFILKTKFNEKCYHYVSLNFYYDKNGKFKSSGLTKYDFVDGK